MQVKSDILCDSLSHHDTFGGKWSIFVQYFYTSIIQNYATWHFFFFNTSLIPHAYLAHGLQVIPKEIMSRKVELGCESWTSFASSCSSTAVQRTLSLWLCPARRLKEQLRSALVAGQWRGDTALTLPLFWRRSTVSPVFFGRYLRSSLHSFVPPPPCRP